MPVVDALVSAGGRDQPGDPLYPMTRGAPKALLDLAGKPMIQWVLEALAGSQAVGRVVVTGLDSAAGLHCGDKPLDVIPDAGSMVDNVRAGARRIRELNPAATHAVWIGSDVPTVQPAHIDWLVQTCLQTDDDAYYTLIEQSVMQARFPDSRRTYARLRDRVVCGGDTHFFNLRMTSDLHPLWEKLLAARKNVLRQAALLGWEPLWLMLTRRMTIAYAEAWALKQLQVRARGIVAPYAEMGMDVDKPAQLAMLARELGQ